jgi:hypothetical protein
MLSIFYFYKEDDVMCTCQVLLVHDCDLLIRAPFRFGVHPTRWALALFANRAALPIHSHPFNPNLAVPWKRIKANHYICIFSYFFHPALLNSSWTGVGT